MIEKLMELAKNSYSPYSHFRVATIVIMKDGTEFSGVNVETSSPAAGICAERNAMLNMITNGENEIRRVLAIMPEEEQALPVVHAGNL